MADERTAVSPHVTFRPARWFSLANASDAGETALRARKAHEGRMNQRKFVSKFALSICLLASACTPESLDQAGTLILATPDRGLARGVVVVDRETAQMDTRFLTGVANNVGSATYRLGGQRRAWLSQQN